MGVTIESKNKSIDMGYIGFNRLRTKVAELASDDIGEHYKELNNAPMFGEEIKKRFFEAYNKETKNLSVKYEGKYNAILNFIYASDCDGKMDVDHCKSIYEVIKDYDDDICYGYSGRKDGAMFKDFKAIVKDCIDTNTPMKWF